MSDFGVETVVLDLPPLAGALSRRLRDAGVPVTPERTAEFARALDLVRPVSRRRLYWTARSVFVSDPAQVRAFDRVFFAVFGSGEPGVHEEPADEVEKATTGTDSSTTPGSSDGEATIEVPLAQASDAE